jgi:hypothetical protein
MVSNSTLPPSLRLQHLWPTADKVELVRVQRSEAAEREAAVQGPLTALEWARANATIVHPTRGRIAFEPYPYQEEFLGRSEASRRIVLKARQIGFSQVFALEALYKAVTEPESTILLVSRSQDLAVNLLRYCYQTYNGLRNPPELLKQNESEMGLANGSRIKSIPANRSTGRGFAASIVYLDEFAYANYAEDIYQSVSPAVSQGGQLVVGSTPNGIGNLFHRLFVSGAGFEKMNVPWHHCPSYYTDEDRAAGLNPEECAWFQKERPKYTDSQWASEYDCSFERSGGGVFRGVSEAAKAIEQEKAVPGHEYVIGIDWGKLNDSTVLSVVDTTLSQQVYMERFNQIDYHFQIARLQVVCEKFHPRLLIPESNSIGGPLIEMLQRADWAPTIQPFTTTNASKAEIIGGLQLAFERKSLQILDNEVQLGELQAYAMERLPGGLFRYGAPPGMHDDTVIALALAWWGASNKPQVAAPRKIYGF